MADHPPAAKLAQAEMYEVHMVPALFAPWAPELLARATPRPGDRVLDVATGTGAVARQVAPMVGAAGRVVGLDPSPAMLGVARGLPAPMGAGVEWVEGKGEALPFPDASFDLVVCQQGLQFFPDRALGLREMRRVLVPGGRVGITVWQAIDRQPAYAALDRAMARHGGGGRLTAPFALGEPEKLTRLLAEAGFADATTESVPGMVRFASTDGWVRRTILGSAAAVPELAGLDAAGMDALIAAVDGEMQGTLREFADGDGLALPSVASVGTGVVKSAT